MRGARRTHPAPRAATAPPEAPGRPAAPPGCRRGGSSTPRCPPLRRGASVAASRCRPSGPHSMVTPLFTLHGATEPYQPHCAPPHDQQSLHRNPAGVSDDVFLRMLRLCRRVAICQMVANAVGCLSDRSWMRPRCSRRLRSRSWLRLRHNPTIGRWIPGLAFVVTLLSWSLEASRDVALQAARVCRCHQRITSRHARRLCQNSIQNSNPEQHFYSDTQTPSRA